MFYKYTKSISIQSSKIYRKLGRMIQTVQSSLLLLNSIRLKQLGRLVLQLRYANKINIFLQYLTSFSRTTGSKPPAPNAILGHFHI